MKEIDALKCVLDFFRDCPTRYQVAYDAMKEEEKLESDLLHKIELDAGYEERNRLATQLKQCLKRRRENKDILEELEPVLEFLEDRNNKKTVDKMVQLLGKMRKVEKYHKNRSYHPRIEG